MAAPFWPNYGPFKGVPTSLTVGPGAAPLDLCRRRRFRVADAGAALIPPTPPLRLTAAATPVPPALRRLPRLPPCPLLALRWAPKICAVSLLSAAAAGLLRSGLVLRARLEPAPPTPAALSSLPSARAVRAARRRDVRMMSSNSGGGGGGPGGGMAPGMGGPVGGGGDGRHDDESALTEFLSSLMDYTPTVWCHNPLSSSLLFCLLA